MITRVWLLACLVVFLIVGCRAEPYGSDERTSRDTTQGDESPSGVTTFGDRDTLSREDLERGRLDDSWRSFAEQDSVARAEARSVVSLPEDFDLRIDTTENDEAWEDITPQAVNSDSIHLPLSGDVAGPSVVRVQILLDQVHVSPGIIDGEWGKNTEKAVYWLQKREGLAATGTVDSLTYRRLLELAGAPEQFIVSHRLTREDVAGPFVQIPEDIYEQAELDRLGYESLLEKLSEMFHSAPDLLRQLNPDVTFEALAAGMSLQVPAVDAGASAAVAPVARLVISDNGHYVHAFDSTGYLLYHFPSTLGSSYDPSPAGDFEVTSITEDPWWHYQPDILAHVDDSEPDARIPPGPNNAVGVVWMALSEPHYGIHGTRAPETIGYVTSAGCVRLTNWDALFLSRRIEAGTPVDFRDTSGGV